MAHSDVRLITLVSSPRAWSHLAPSDETVLNTVLRCAVITVVPPQNTRWLSRSGAGAIPLVAAGFERNAALRTSVQR